MSESSPNSSGGGTTRRSFLKNSTVTAAGGALAASIASRSYAGNAIEELRVALVGCGGRGTGAAEQALSTSGPVKLVAAVDAFSDRLNSSVERLKRSKPEQVDVPEDSRYVGFDGYKQAIDRDDVDVVLLCTPPGFRPLHFERAIEQGKHVFMEKPVGVDGPGIKRVLDAGKKADEKGLKVVVGVQRRYQRSYIETLERLHEGAIGDILYTRVYWNGGGVWTRPRQDDQTEMEYQMRNWYYFNWLCGDHIVEQHIHNHDVGNWVHGDYPVMANGMGGREVRTGRDHGEIYDHHAVEYIYADGSRMISQCRHIPNCWNNVSEHAVGTKGESNVSGAMINPFDGDDWRFRGENPNPYQLEHDALFRAIRENEPLNDTEHGAMSTMTAILGRYATYSGNIVRMQDALDRGKDLAPGIENYDFDDEPPVLPDEDGYFPIAVPGQYDPLEPRA